MKLKTIKGVQLNAPIKEEIRDLILKLANKKGASMLDLYGNGNMYGLVKANTKCKILSIDNDIMIKPELRGKDRMFCNIQELKNKTNRKFNLIWLDYCGPYKEDVTEDIKSLESLLEDEGTIFFTFLHGRETIAAKGTQRRILDKAIEEILIEDFKSINVKIESKGNIAYPTAPIYATRRTKRSNIMTVRQYEWQIIK